MKIDRRKFLAASSSALVLAKSQLSSAARVPRSEASENLAIAERIEGREVKVYTTDDNSNHRLAATDTLVFKHLGQPLETQICVFVDPAKTFQTILGIGGALTDASAETFAKLPGAKQREILNAYFDPSIGIGYTLARTNIQTSAGHGRRETQYLWQSLESTRIHEGQQQYASWWKTEAGVLSILGQLLHEVH